MSAAMRVIFRDLAPQPEKSRPPSIRAEACKPHIARADAR